MQAIKGKTSQRRRTFCVGDAWRTRLSVLVRASRSLRREIPSDTEGTVVEPSWTCAWRIAKFLNISCEVAILLGSFVRDLAVLFLHLLRTAARLAGVIFTDILEFRGRVLVIQAGKGRLRESGADLGHGSARLLELPRDPLVRAVASRRTGGSPWSAVGDHAAAWMEGQVAQAADRLAAARARRVQRRHAPSGLLEPRPLG
jgi:hypothetical protein